jgi:hypothetical protein
MAGCTNTLAATKSRLVRVACAVSMVATLTGGVTGAVQDATTSTPALTYLGRIRMPAIEDLAFSAGGLAIRTNPAGYRELLSLDRRGQIFGVRLPSEWDDSIATDHQTYGIPQVPEGHRVWALGLDHTGDLLIFHAPYYPTEAESDLPSITRYALTNTGLTFKRGPFAVRDVHFHRRQGGAFVLPDDVAERFGGRKTVVGFGGFYNIIHGASPGTAAYAVDLDTWRASTLIEFPWGGGADNERRRADYTNTDDDRALKAAGGSGPFDGFWTFTDTRSGAAWGHNGMWVVGQEATGRVRYGDEAGESGFHADAFKPFLRFYPRAELERLWDGKIDAHETRPAYWRLGEIPDVPPGLGTVLDVQGRTMLNAETRVNGLVIEGDLLLIGGPLAWGGTYNDFPVVYAFRIGSPAQNHPVAPHKSPPG